MKGMKGVAGLIMFVLLFSGLLKAETDREMLVKRWKVTKHQKSGKIVPLASHDFLQFKSDGVYEHARNGYYAKGSWAVIADELTINNNGEHKWKITSVSETTMSLVKGEETMDLEVVIMPAPVDKTRSANVQHLCTGKWRPNEHHKGDVVVKMQPADIMVFFTDGTYEQILNGVYSKGNWRYNKEETELTIDSVTWKVDSLSALFFKMTKMPDAKEFMVFAHTR
jgi:hypothetical protein